MSLEQTINNDIKTAMLAKDKKSLDALRAIKSAILLLKTDKNIGDITPEVEMATLQKMAKQRKESAEMYKAQGREDLCQEELGQLEIISKYLPEQLSAEAIKTQLQSLIAQNGITGIKDMGKLMGIAGKFFAGKADNKTIAEIVKSLLK
ncbi:MAG: GatB/YqeY domain-containing protein [Bacteroidales bacterium]|nr:GatB/YqeY domain-containing protein [Bacteroidales bacterium]